MAKYTISEVQSCIPGNRSLTVAAPIGAARVSERSGYPIELLKRRTMSPANPLRKAGLLGLALLGGRRASARRFSPAEYALKARSASAPSAHEAPHAR